MPAYTLRGYTLSVAVASQFADTIYSESSVNLPILEPGSDWSGELTIDNPNENQNLILRVIRPTGSTVIERMYDSNGEPLPQTDIE